MKRYLSILLALLMTFSLCACGSAAKMSQSTTPEAAYDAAPAENGVSYSYEESGLGAADMPMAEPGERSADTGTDSAPDVNPDKIIYSADATVETTDFDGTVEAVNELVKAHGGFVESSSVNGANYYSISRGYASTRSAYFTIRIPSSDFNEVMNSLSTLGNVPYTNCYSENISSRYYDAEARLNAYKTQEESLLKMMELAESVEDIIAIEDKLSDIRYNIESLQTTLNSWDRQVSYSTVNLSVNEVREYTPEPEEQIGYGRELWLSLRDGLKSVYEFFKDFLVWLVGALPTLAVLTALFFAFRPLLRRLNDKRKARKAEKAAGKAAKKAEKE